MNFSEAKQHALGVLFSTDYFSRFVTYTPRNGTAVPDVPANILYGQQTTAGGESPTGDGHTWRLTVSRAHRADFSHGVARQEATVVLRVSDVPTPEYRDTLTFDDTAWLVTEVYNA